jgi:hypothetical protein
MVQDAKHIIRWTVASFTPAHVSVERAVKKELGWAMAQSNSGEQEAFGTSTDYIPHAKVRFLFQRPERCSKLEQRIWNSRARNLFAQVGGELESQSSAKTGHAQIVQQTFLGSFWAVSSDLSSRNDPADREASPVTA